MSHHFLHTVKYVMKILTVKINKIGVRLYILLPNVFFQLSIYINSQCPISIIITPIQPTSIQPTAIPRTSISYFNLDNERTDSADGQFICLIIADGNIQLELKAGASRSVATDMTV